MSDAPLQSPATPAPTEPVLTDGEKQVIGRYVRWVLPKIAAFVCSDHANVHLTAVLKLARAVLAAAGLTDAAGSAFTDTAAADAVDAVCVALPVILEALSHYRDAITAWVARKAGVKP